ncbi:MAG: NAD(+) synthase [Candidatus Dormibacteraeota bacterium]|nr:NAD(+) synthase [Candidatus Dormibacteraeota bacterium]
MTPQSERDASPKAAREGFRSLYAHGFVRVAAAVPRVRVADPVFNTERTLALARRAAERGALLTVFPELGISAYTDDDLFHQQALLDAVEASVAGLLAASRDIASILLVGAPVRSGHALFNCALVVHRGALLGVAPKSYLPSYREFYEKRYFVAARDALEATVHVAGQTAPFGNDLLFECESIPGFVLHAEVCEDVWVPISPSAYAALGGATVLANLSASNVTIAKADYRRLLCESHSARTVAAYIYTAAGDGESTTDLAWDGQALICENGNLLAESERFAGEEQLITADVDLDRLVADRMRMTSYVDNARDHHERLRHLRRIRIDAELPAGAPVLERAVERFPYVPQDPATRADRCGEVYRIQVHGLATRLRSTRIEKVVVGVSGGLDSTQALIVAARTMDVLGHPRANVLAYALPGFATSRATLENAHKLMRALGVTESEIDIRPGAEQMLRDIGHPAADGAAEYDVPYENVQAGQRTSLLFRLANRHGALVVGTGDLSELALGWSTYGVGDQMSHYNVNASVPKTLIQFLVRWVADTNELGDDASAVLRAIADTVISPELVPGAGDEPGQHSEDVVGPYELQDFFLYHVLRFGFAPSKVAYLAHHAWSECGRGAWPDLIPPQRRHQYSLADIKHWLRVFVQRFFEYSQFKRSALPNGPKVGSGGSLSPRGDWRAPSDASAAAWLQELESGVPDSW